MTLQRKGTSQLISYAIYIGVGVSAVSLIIVTAMPFIEDVRDSAEIENQIEYLTGLEQQIRGVASASEGSRTSHTLEIQRGSLSIENDTIIYELPSGTDIIEPGTRRQFGSVTVSSNANSRLTNATYNGNDCYKLQNSHIAVCIKKVGTTTFTQHPTDELLLYLRNKRSGTTTEPSLDILPDSQSQTTDPAIKMKPMTSGQGLGTAHLAVAVKPTDQAPYIINFRLQTGADFMEIEVE